MSKFKTFHTRGKQMNYTLWAYVICKLPMIYFIIVEGMVHDKSIEEHVCDVIAKLVALALIVQLILYFRAMFSVIGIAIDGLLKEKTKDKN